MSTNNGFFSNLKSDIPASIVVFLVALPLCLGIAQVSEAPLFSGIIAGIVGGIIVSLMSGSAIGVSGPAAGLAAIVAAAITELGGFEIFLVAVVIGGVFQLLLGIAKAGVIGYYFPNSVIKGMLSGIGLVIILKEIPHAFGVDKDAQGDWSWFQKDGETTITELFNIGEHIGPGPLIVTVFALAVLLLWERPFMKKISLFRILNGPMVAVFGSVGLAVAFVGNEALEISGDHLVSIPPASNFEEFRAYFKHPDWSALGNQQVWIVGATIAVVASLETLLCVEATDKLDPQKRTTPTNRELLAQGTGNVVSGLIGGLPITQVIVRSSANIQSGGKTKASAFFHGLLLLASAAFITPYLNMIPMACLAAILLVVGYKLAKPSLFKAMYKKGISEFVPFIVTIVFIVFTNLLVGIGLGLAVGIVQILWNNYRVPYHFNPSDHTKGQPARVELSEDVSFLNKAGIRHTLDMLPDGEHVIIDGSKTKNIHPDVLEIIEDFRENAKTRDITIEMVGLGDGAFSGNPVRQFGRTVLNKP